MGDSLRGEECAGCGAGVGEIWGWLVKNIIECASVRLQEGSGYKGCGGVPL